MFFVLWSIWDGIQVEHHWKSSSKCCLRTSTWIAGHCAAYCRSGWKRKPWSIWQSTTLYETFFPGAAVFSWDILFDCQYLVNWNDIGEKDRILLIMPTRKEMWCLTTMIINICRQQDQEKAWLLFPSCTGTLNSTISIQHGHITEYISSRGLMPYF